MRATYTLCLGPLDQEVSTMDLLKRIELKMEQLTQQLERLPAEKVKISQRVRRQFTFYTLLVLNHFQVQMHYFWSNMFQVIFKLTHTTARGS